MLKNVLSSSSVLYYFFIVVVTAAAIRKFNISEMLSFVNALGGWPVIDPHWDEDNYNWMIPAAASTLWNPRNNKRLMPRGYLFGVKPDRDLEDTSKYILYVRIFIYYWATSLKLLKIVGKVMGKSVEEIRVILRLYFKIALHNFEYTLLSMFYVLYSTINHLCYIYLLEGLITDKLS